MLEFKIFCAVAASLISLFNAVRYLGKTLKRQVKPHCFTWLTWGSLMVISGLAMFKADAGFASYATTICGLFSFTIGVVAVFYGHKEITLTDKISLSLAALAIILWQLTKNPLAALISTSIADTLGYYPTFRKVYNDPKNENVIAFLIYSIANVFWLLSIKTYNFTTLLYPSVILSANVGLIFFILIRRKQLAYKLH